MELKEAINYLIDQKIMSESDMARVTGKSQPTVNRWRRGIYSPPYEIGKKLLDIAEKAKRRKPLY